MIDHFAGDCNTFCSNSNLSPSLKAVCDTGGYQYCSTGTNIYNTNCKSYLKRVVGNKAADRNNIVYSDPIRFMAGSTSKLQDYYNAIAERVSQTSETTDLTSSGVKDIVDIIKSEDNAYQNDLIYNNLTNNAFNYCTSSKNVDTNFCSDNKPDLSWAAQEFKNQVNKLIDEFIKKNIQGSLLSYYNSLNRPSVIADLELAQSIHIRMPNAIKPIDDMILASLTINDLVDPNLILLRKVSPYLQLGVDNFVINLINQSKNTFKIERLTGDTVYNIDLTNNDQIYSNTFRIYLKNLISYNNDNNITTDPFLTLIQETDDKNIINCSSDNIDPLTDPLCVSINNSIQTTNYNGATDAQDIKKVIANYCSKNENIYKSDCVSHINNNQPYYNLQDVNRKMLNYCLSDVGKIDNVNCNTFSSINGSSEWLKDNTKNTKDNTTGTITTICGSPGNLTKDECQLVCNQYPSVCQSDIEMKCSLPENRYSTNKDYFKSKEPFYGLIGGEYGDSSIILLIMNIILWLLIAVLASGVITSGVFMINNYIENKRYIKNSLE